MSKEPTSVVNLSGDLIDFPYLPSLRIALLVQCTKLCMHNYVALHIYSFYDDVANAPKLTDEEIKDFFSSVSYR